mgnify:CR=1 FL=1
MKYSAKEIKAALDNHELLPYYQPQYDAITNQLKSAEALVRWINPDGTIISPCYFIPVAEKSDLIIHIDWYIAECVCKTLVKQNVMPQFPIAVNFSRRHIREKNFAKKLSELMDKYELPHKLLEVEITESAMVAEADKLLDWIISIRNAGFTVAIDDFGSGLSSLQFVKDVPADVLKIDRSLLSRNCEDEKERIVLESIFTFANRLHMKTVAEGVETKEQLAFLRTCDCNKIQGFLFAKPMPEEEYLSLCQLHHTAEDPTDVLQLQSPASTVNLLMEAIFRRYPLVIFSNLTRNTYYMMAYQNFSTTSCPSTGEFDQLISHGASTMHPDDRESFSTTFNREKLINDYRNHKEEVHLVTRQMGDDGIYRRVETADYFVKSNYSDDIIAITLCDNLPD